MNQIRLKAGYRQKKAFFLCDFRQQFAKATRIKTTNFYSSQDRAFSWVREYARPNPSLGLLSTTLLSVIFLIGMQWQLLCTSGPVRRAHQWHPNQWLLQCCYHLSCVPSASGLPKSGHLIPTESKDRLLRQFEIYILMCLNDCV